MKITYGKNGIRMKKLFGSREISYSDIRSAVLDKGEYTFTTKKGEVITAKYQLFEDRTVLYEAIKKYNIYFKDAEEPDAYENVYFAEELNEKILQAQAMIKEYAGSCVRSKLGPEYDVDTVVMDEGELINVYFRLLKSGELVKDIPDEAKYDFSELEPYAFDSFVMAYLVEWDGCGKYGLTQEMENRKMCVKYLEGPLKCLLENYEG